MRVWGMRWRAFCRGSEKRKRKDNAETLRARRYAERFLMVDGKDRTLENARVRHPKALRSYLIASKVTSIFRVRPVTGSVAIVVSTGWPT